MLISATPAPTPQPLPASTSSPQITQAAADQQSHDPPAPQPDPQRSAAAKPADPKQEPSPKQTAEADPDHSVSHVQNVQSASKSDYIQDPSQASKNGLIQQASDTPVSQHGSQPVSQFGNQPGNQPENQSGSQSGSQPGSQPGSQSDIDDPSQDSKPLQSGGTTHIGDPQVTGYVASEPLRPIPDANKVEVKGHTLTENGKGLDIGSQHMVYTSGSVFVGAHVVAIPTVQQTEATQAPVVLDGLTFSPLLSVRATRSIPSAFPITTIASRPVIALPSGGLKLGSTTLSIGASLAISGTPISVGSFAVIVGSHTITYPPATPISSVFTVGGETFTAVEKGFAVAGTSLYNGGPGITLAGQEVSFGSSGLIIGGKTYDVPAQVFTVASHKFTVAGSGLVVDGHTLLAGGAATTIEGTAVSIDPAGDIIIGSGTKALGVVTGAPNFGDLIMSAFGMGSSDPDSQGVGSNPPSNAAPKSHIGDTKSIIAFQGPASRKVDAAKAWGLMLALGFGWAAWKWV